MEQHQNTMFCGPETTWPINKGIDHKAFDFYQLYFILKLYFLELILLYDLFRPLQRHLMNLFYKSLYPADF